MATAKISELVASAPAAAISDADGFELVQGGVTKGGVFSQVRDYVLLGVTRVPGQRYTIDLDSQADSDPGAGLLKFNNATPSSATEIYLDDETLDAIDLSVYLATLSSTGWIKIQSALDKDEWIIFRWTALVDSTGYWKFTVVAQAFNGTLDDADEVVIHFDSGAADGPITAEDVGIADVGTHYTSDNVEGALQEVPGLITAAINALIGGAPGALDTLNELADALADDAGFATTVTNALALKAPLASPALTGTPTAPTAAPGTNTTQVATTAFVAASVGEVGTLPALIIPLAVSDETTALTTGVKSTFRWPQAQTITGVAASLTDAQATGSTFTVDVKVGGVSILSTLITIDNTEEHSGSADVPPVVSGGSYAYTANGEITIEITQVGDGTAKGLKVYLICDAGEITVEVGDVTGPGSSTDHALVRWDGAGGDTVQDSGVIVTDANEISGYRGNINRQTGTSYELVAADSGKIVECVNASAIAVTLPNDLPKGFNCTVVQDGAGQITFTAEGGGSLKNRQSHTKTAGNGAFVALYVSSNSGTDAAWRLGGDTAA